MSKTKKEYLSDPINIELDWINDIRNRYIRSNMRQLDLSISITYTLETGFQQKIPLGTNSGKTHTYK
ncbi:MAG: hypothetical protein J6I46_03130 [Ruminococcus sp.]|nr:hypothetical protein [Ruminococcus sp.]